MEFRYREMVYRPDYYDFHNDDREEWYPNGIFNYNVSRLIKDLAADENEKDSRAPWLNTAVKVPVSVKEAIDHCHGLGHLEEEHIQAADLDRPLIFIELAPDSFNLIDGHHRLEKARRQGITELPAWMVFAHAAVHYLGSEAEYSRYVNYWNLKIEDLGDAAAYRGLFCPFLISLEMVESAAACFERWHGNVRFSTEIRENRKVIKRTLRHADVLMACVRVFSEY